MRILYAGMKYDYGDPARGLSFEHTNIYDSLAHMGHEIIYFDFVEEFQRRGKPAMNARILDIARTEKPDLLFCVLFTDQFDLDTIRTISERTDVTTFNWFADDHWRFDNYSRFWAPAFNWVSTTAQSALPKYAAIGYKNVIKTQWACDHFQYRPLGLPLKYDVTFIGQPHGNRRETIAALRAAGIDVQTWGFGWENGRVEQDEMIAIFNQSRINLNLANASILEPGPLPRRALRRALRHSPHIIRSLPLAQRVLTLSSRPVASQIKGRNFEVPGTGGFLLTDPADNLDQYYIPDREIGLFNGVDTLAARIRHYLDHEDERAAIARAGHARTVAEHTYEQRFNALFAAMGLPAHIARTTV